MNSVKRTNSPAKPAARRPRNRETKITDNRRLIERIMSMDLSKALPALEGLKGNSDALVFIGSFHHELTVRFKAFHMLRKNFSGLMVLCNGEGCPQTKLRGIQDNLLLNTLKRELLITAAINGKSSLVRETAVLDISEKYPDSLVFLGTNCETNDSRNLAVERISDLSKLAKVANSPFPDAREIAVEQIIKQKNELQEKVQGSDPQERTEASPKLPHVVEILSQLLETGHPDVKYLIAKEVAPKRISEIAEQHPEVARMVEVDKEISKICKMENGEKLVGIATKYPDGTVRMEAISQLFRLRNLEGLRQVIASETKYHATKKCAIGLLVMVPLKHLTLDENLLVCLNVGSYAAVKDNLEALKQDETKLMEVAAKARDYEIRLKAIRMIDWTPEKAQQVIEQTKHVDVKMTLSQMVETPGKEFAAGLNDILLRTQI